MVQAITINPSILCLVSIVYQLEPSLLPPNVDVRTICTTVDAIKSAQPAINFYPSQSKANLSTGTYKTLHYLGPFLLLNSSEILLSVFSPPSTTPRPPPLLTYTTHRLHGDHCIFYENFWVVTRPIPSIWAQKLPCLYASLWKYQPFFTMASHQYLPCWHFTCLTLSTSSPPNRTQA